MTQKFDPQHKFINPEEAITRHFEVWQGQPLLVALQMFGLSDGAIAFRLNKARSTIAAWRKGGTLIPPQAEMDLREFVTDAIGVAEEVVLPPAEAKVVAAMITYARKALKS
jgi:hypothetical protein